jgi:GNAT superfamily N-acetyltransferase
MPPLSVVEEDFLAPVVQALLREWGREAETEFGSRPTRGSMVSPNDFAPPSGAFFVAMKSDAAVGCAGLRPLSDTEGEVKRLFVSTLARRQGVAGALLAIVEHRAAAARFSRLRLDTNSDAAVALFLSLGYRPIPDYNSNPRARHWLEKRL